MKYVVILIAVIILVRIDLVLKFFDKTAVKYQNKSIEIAPGEVVAGGEIVPVASDLSFKTSPRKNFISMLNDFRTVQDISVKDKAIELLRLNPTIFPETLDLEFESSIYRWRDLLVQKNKMTHDFLIEMMSNLKGENLQMVMRFYSFAIDVDMGEFLNAYSKSNDSNCLIMDHLGDNLPEDEKYNELAERLAVLDAFLLTDKAAPIKLYGQHCQMILKLKIDQLKVVEVPSQDAVSVPDVELNPEPVPLAVPAPPSVNTGNTP